jgi:hypothetical protein
MTARSLFNLILKILGIFFIKDILDALSRSVSVLVYFRQYSSQKEALINLGVTLPSLILYTFFVLLLIFRSNAIINFFKLDGNMANEPIPVQLHRSVILNIAVIVAGGWMLVSGLPEFIRQIIYYLQERKLYVRMAHPDISYLAMSFVKIVIGILLIVCPRVIVYMIEVKRGKQVSSSWPVKAPFTGKKKKNTG